MKIFHRLPSYENISQTEAVIEAIRRFPGIKRSDLIDLSVNNNRIANLTARITNARAILAKKGETIKCTQAKAAIRIGCNRYTTYEIVPIIEEK